MNWGKGITIFLILFIGFITTLAVVLMRANTELVSDDYYLKEIKYGDEILAEQNAIDAGAFLETEISPSGLFIRLIKNDLPEEIQIYMMRGNNQDQDIVLKSEGSSVFVDRSDLFAGKYKLTVTWMLNDKSYQLKEEVWIQ